MENENNYLSIACFFLAIFCTTGWYFAETDNEILRQELAAQSYSQSVHFEGKSHDR